MSRSDSTERRVVVTGLGAVTPLGIGVADFWNALVSGKSGAAPISQFDASELDTTFACEVKGFDPLASLDRKQANRLDPVTHFAVAATDEALRDAGLEAGRATSTSSTCTARPRRPAIWPNRVRCVRRSDRTPTR